MPKVRIGFVGVGAMGQCAHLRNYVTIPDCEVVALAEVRADLGRKVAARYGVPHVYQSDEEMLRHEQLDGLVASQPFTRHGSILPELLKARLPMFIEKPLAGSIEQGEKILEAIRQSGTWAMVGYHKRSDPAVIFARNEIKRLKGSGELGPLRYIRITMPAGDWVQGGFTDLISTDTPVPPMEQDPPAADMDADAYQSYIAFVNYYIHQVNLMRYLLGEPYKVTYADPSGVLLATQSESGVAGSIEMSPYTTSVGWQESALVGFERGYIKVDLPAPLAQNQSGTVEVLRDPGSNNTPPQTIRPSLPPVHAMRQQAIYFVRAIQGAAKPPCLADEALEDLRVAREYIRLCSGK